MTTEEALEIVLDEIAKEALHRALNPAIPLPLGYCIMDTRPGAVNHWRRLYGPDGNVPRPLAQLRAAEESLEG